MKQTINFQNSSKNVDIYIYIYIIFSQKYKSRLDPVRLVWSHFEYLCAMSAKKSLKNKRKKEEVIFKSGILKRLLSQIPPFNGTGCILIYLKKKKKNPNGNIK